MDDEGLTDAQEITAITEAEETPRGGAAMGGESYIRQSGRLNDVETSPVNADTDGDGYWDGWVGGYNVSYSRNVILYPENLKDGDGIETGERVDEQVGTHRIAEAPTPTDRYAVINEEKRHSNLHMGELHWKTNPADDGDAAYEQTELRLEVDYHAQADDKARGVLNSNTSTVPTTYALYGMNITFNVDDEITDFEDISIDNRSHAQDIEDDHHDQADSTAYYFITKRWPGKGVGGVTSTNGNNYAHLGYGVFILTDNLSSSKVDHAHTSVHEIGHLLGAGRLDDKSLDTLAPDIWKGEIKPDLSEGEVYSGDPNVDKTPELVDIGDISGPEWSTMSDEYAAVDDQPMNGVYVAFSIEEVLKLEFQWIATRGDNEEVIDV